MYKISFHFPGFFRFKFSKSLKVDNLDVLVEFLERLEKDRDFLLISDSGKGNRYCFQLNYKENTWRYEVTLETTIGDFCKTMDINEIIRLDEIFERLLANPLGYGFNSEDGMSMSKNIKQVLSAMKDLPEYIGIDFVEPNTKGIFGNYPLNVAVIQSDIEAIKMLLESGADINAQGEHGYSALHEAIEGENYMVVELLLASGANVHLKNSDGLSSLEFAQFFDEQEIFNLMKKYA